MDRPKEGEYYAHTVTGHLIFITAVGLRNVLATGQFTDGIQEQHYSFRELQERYERKETKKS